MLREFKYYLDKEVRKIKQKIYKPINLKLFTKIVERLKQQKEHAKKRFSERYGFKITDEDYTHLNNQIRNKKAHFITHSGPKNSHNSHSEIWRIEFKENKVYAFFDVSSNQISTFIKYQNEEELQREIKRHQNYLL